MSVCNLGRPPQDAGLQNLIVNDTLRVNKLLKATKAEVERLCAGVNQTPSVTLTGSAIYLNNPGTGVPFLFPSGPTYISNNSFVNYEANLYTTMWTDEALLVEDFRAAINGIGTQGEPPVFTPNIRLVVASTLAELNVGIPNGTELITLTFPNVTLTTQSLVSQTVPVTIPAGSYVGIRLDSGQSYSQVNLTWTLRYQKQ